ncbi:Solanapyrone synthase [Penicillium ucsense]|uniref:Solanapyrone synthase n=1 Tax=Penicillium ucsense TaxID=2839758 RepID=A0A8J8W7R3_9EURO|nr:Solanapyrone synthase [Penicillium ucsense]KAF7738178.1 Solanapyrone synthase [Penicillium ucsense]
MRFASTVLPLAAAVGLASASDCAPATTKGCQALQNGYLSDSLFTTGSPVYNWETKQFWSNTELMSPGCVFRPKNSRDLGRAVKALVKADAKFAVRGGGHMGIQGSNNIDDGVLIVMSNLTTMALSRDHSVLSLGPAYRWGEVYSYLADYDLTVPGGRLGPVGVPGLLLAGGINFYGNQVGFGCNSVINYEVVLANGDVVQANKQTNSDLFWALKGGSSNFGIVTRFDLETIKSTKVWAGAHTVDAQYVDQFLAAVATYAANISDAKSHIVPALVPSASGGSTLASAILFYDSDTVSYPDILKPFTDIPSISSTVGFKTVAEFANELGQMVVPGINDIFVAGTVKGTTYDQLHKGVSIINSTFFNELPKLLAQVPAANISTIQLDWQPIGAKWMDASNARGGNALGLDSSKVYLCYAEVVEWIGSEYDNIVVDWLKATTEAINKATQAAGIYDEFNYMGDSAGFQSIFPGYGAANHRRLQSIASAYDPTQVFQKLMPGGYKVY